MSELQRQLVHGMFELQRQWFSEFAGCGSRAKKRIARRLQLHASAYKRVQQNGMETSSWVPSNAK